MRQKIAAKLVRKALLNNIIEQFPELISQYSEIESECILWDLENGFKPNAGAQAKLFEHIALNPCDRNPTKYRWLWYRGGLNSGKSFAGAAFTCVNAKRDPAARQLISANSYGQLRTSTLVALAEFCKKFRVPLKPVASVPVDSPEWADLTAEKIARNRFCTIFGAPILVLSAEAFTGRTDKSSEVGRGLQIRAVWGDEWAYAAKSAFLTVNGRLGRGPGEMPGIGLITSSINKNNPYNYCYDLFDSKDRTEEQKQQFFSIRGSSSENIYADRDYLESMRASLTKEMALIELEGEYTTVAEGIVYSNFDRHLNNCDDTVKAGDLLHIGMDFNVGKMAAIVHVIRGQNQPRAVDEFIDLMDTPAMIKAIQERYPNHHITIYPDASGNNRSTKNASKSDIELLRQAGFTIVVDASNPGVKDRINATNAAFCNDIGDRRFLINTAKCPRLTRSLESQVWVNGEPDKKNGFDHANDACSYFICKLMPIQGRQFGEARAIW